MNEKNKDGENNLEKKDKKKPSKFVWTEGTITFLEDTKKEKTNDSNAKLLQ